MNSSHTFPLPHCLSTCRGSTHQGLSWNQPLGGRVEEILIGKGTQQQKADPARIASDDRTDLE